MWGDTLESDTQVKAIKSDSDSDSDEQKRSPGFSGKNRGVTPSVAAPGVTRPSDATDSISYNMPTQVMSVTLENLYLPSCM